MNYIWELLVESMRQGIDETKIYFNIFNLRKNTDDSKTHSYKRDYYGYGGEKRHYYAINTNVSPYSELSPSSVFQKVLTEETLARVDVNPYIRFIEIFYGWLSPDIEICAEFSEKLADVIIHYLARIDMKSGAGKRDYYIRFIERDIENGIFGDAESFRLFNRAEKRRIASEILDLYATGDYMGCAKRAVKEILPFCQILSFAGEEIIFYLRTAENGETEAKVNFIIKLFMPLNIKVSVHWQHTYGVIDSAGKTTRLEQFIVK